MQDAADSAARNISASGGALRTEIAARPIDDLHAEIPEIEPSEVQAVESVIDEAKSSAMGAVLDSEREADVKLRSGARENGAAFTSSVESIVEQVSSKLPETEQSIRSAGDAVVSLIDEMAGSQLVGIDAAESRALDRIAEAKTKAANLLGAGRIAAGELSARTSAHVAAVEAQEAAAQQQLQAAATSAGDQIASRADASSYEANRFAAQTRVLLQQGVQRAIAVLDHATAPALGELGCVGAAFGGEACQHRDHLLAGIDNAIGAAEIALAQGLGDLTNQAVRARADASATYVS